jgi:hypothetical protein
MLGTMRQTRTKQTREDVVNQQGSGYADGLDNEPYFQMGLQSARRVVQQWREAGADVVILEGNVNPAIHHARTPERRRQTRVFLEDVSRTTGARYIPSENQAYSPSPQDWQDGTHLNKEASLAFTRYLATPHPGSLARITLSGALNLLRQSLQNGGLRKDGDAGKQSTIRRRG